MRLLISCFVLLVVPGVWAQQSRQANAPEKADGPLTRSSFSASGLHNDKVLTNFFIGDFANIPFERSNVVFVSLFEDYLESYGRHCDAYLPPNKVEMTQTVCAVQETQIDRYGSRVGTGGCLQYSTEGMGIYADPALYAAKSKLGDEAGLSMIQDAFQTMKQKNPLEAALNTLNQTQQMADDMSGLFRLNSCVSPGVKRLQENIVLFSMGKQPIVLPGAAPSVTPRAQPTTGGPFRDQNYTKLLEDLTLDQSRSWIMNRFVSGSTSNVVVSSWDSAGRPAKIVGTYLFNGRSQGSVTLSFSDGVPECMYFSDSPSSCKTPDSRIVAAYSSGSYQQLEPGIIQRGGVSAANPVPVPARAQPVQPAPNRAASTQLAPATPPVATPPPAPVLTAEQQRQQHAAEIQNRAAKFTACREQATQALKDLSDPEDRAKAIKEYTACIQAK